MATEKKQQTKDEKNDKTAISGRVPPVAKKVAKAAAFTAGAVTAFLIARSILTVVD